MIILDASVLIAYLDDDDEHHTRAEALLAREIDDDFAVSTLTLAEVLVAPTRHHRADEVHLALEALEVDEIPIPAGAADSLAELHVVTGLKMPDCCVLLAAEAAAARLASFDGRLLRVAGGRNVVVLGD